MVYDVLTGYQSSWFFLFVIITKSIVVFFKFLLSHYFPTTLFFAPEKWYALVTSFLTVFLYNNSAITYVCLYRFEQKLANFSDCYCVQDMRKKKMSKIKTFFHNFLYCFSAKTLCWRNIMYCDNFLSPYCCLSDNYAITLIFLYTGILSWVNYNELILFAVYYIYQCSDMHMLTVDCLLSKMDKFLNNFP